MRPAQLAVLRLQMRPVAAVVQQKITLAMEARLPQTLAQQLEDRLLRRRQAATAACLDTISPVMEAQPPQMPAQREEDRQLQRRPAATVAGAPSARVATATVDWQAQ
jgi:hypothetical protein